MDEETLKQKLTPEQYKVLRQKGTERPFTGKYVHRTADGDYVCMVCENPLFTSDAQFDSGTGWPSFDKAIEGSIKYQDDLPAPRPDIYFVYVLQCNNDAMYIGQTQNLSERWKMHCSGDGAEYTKRYQPKYILHYEEYGSREEVVEREKWLKTGFGRKWLEREIKSGRARQAGHGATEIVCAKCNSHLGHVFDDGPTATGKRYCINSVCLDLKAKT